MDTVRTAEIQDATVEGGLTRVALFTAVSVGEAP
jgi:hypothetical protein